MGVRKGFLPQTRYVLYISLVSQSLFYTRIKENFPTVLSLPWWDSEIILVPYSEMQGMIICSFSEKTSQNFFIPICLCHLKTLFCGFVRYMAFSWMDSIRGKSGVNNHGQKVLGIWTLSSHTSDLFGSNYVCSIMKMILAKSRWVCLNHSR